MSSLPEGMLNLRHWLLLSGYKGNYSRGTCSTEKMPSAWSNNIKALSENDRGAYPVFWLVFIPQPTSPKQVMEPLLFIGPVYKSCYVKVGQERHSINITLNKKCCTCQSFSDCILFVL